MHYVLMNQGQSIYMWTTLNRQSKNDSFMHSLFSQIWEINIFKIYIMRITFQKICKIYKKITLQRWRGKKKKKEREREKDEEDKGDKVREKMKEMRGVWWLGWEGYLLRELVRKRGWWPKGALLERRSFGLGNCRQGWVWFWGSRRGPWRRKKVVVVRTLLFLLKENWEERKIYWKRMWVWTVKKVNEWLLSVVMGRVG